jgi:anaerobic selenocysteine-containing dehydrogenase
VRCELARRLGANDPRFAMSEREHIDEAFRRGGLGGLAAIEKHGWLDRAQGFEKAHFLDGFGHADGRFRFNPDWAAIGPYADRMPRVADWMDDYERASVEHPLKLVTPPARHFLNSTFTETPTSVAKEGGAGPCVRVHPETARAYGVGEGARVLLGNRRGWVIVRATLDAGQQPGTLVVESIWPSSTFEEGRGINTLTGEDPVPPNGGVAFHDTAVWMRLA